VSSQLITSIHWTCYGIVHVYVVINFCDSMWCFEWKRICAGFFIVCLYPYCHWRLNYQEREGWNPINWFNPATFSCLSKSSIWFSNVIYHGLCYAQLVEVRGHCLFCWYWWYCWPSQFKLSLHNLLKKFVDFCRHSSPIKLYNICHNRQLDLLSKVCMWNVRIGFVLKKINRTNLW